MSEERKLKLYDPSKKCRRMEVTAFMSGSGTNIRKLLELERRLDSESENGSPFHVNAIYSDRQDGQCNAERIAREYVLPYISHDIRAFYKQKGVKRTVKTDKGMVVRVEFDATIFNLMHALGTDVTAFGGYMSFFSRNSHYPSINVHPADLRILDDQGKRKYTGDRAVRDAIKAGEKEIRASTILIDEGVDTGPLLMISKPLEVDIGKALEDLMTAGTIEFPEPPSRYPIDPRRLHDTAPDIFKAVVGYHQGELKKVGDWNIFPRTIREIAEGNFEVTPSGVVYYKGKKGPLVLE